MNGQIIKQANNFKLFQLLPLLPWLFLFQLLPFLLSNLHPLCSSMGKKEGIPKKKEGYLFKKKALM
jgi:hypothetical protein